MDEADWLSCRDLEGMVKFLRVQRGGTARWWRRLLDRVGHLRPDVSVRKLRLFVCACFRRYMHLFPDTSSQRAIENAELHADGLVAGAALLACLEEAQRLFTEGCFLGWDTQNEHGVICAGLEACLYPLGMGGDWMEYGLPTPVAAVHDLASRCASLAHAAFSDPTTEGSAKQAAEVAIQAHLCRDIFGNPFRPIVLDPAWQTPAVLALAQAAYCCCGWCRLWNRTTI